MTSVESLDDQLELFPVDKEIESELGDSVDGLVEAFGNSNQGFSVDRLVADPELNTQFQAECERISVPGMPVDRNRYLFRIRKSGKLKSYKIKTNEPTRIDWNEIDSFVFASEIAWRKVYDRHNVSLDEIFCDPLLATKFDSFAEELASDAPCLQLRWGALKIRKESSNARKRAKSKTPKRLGVSHFKEGIPNKTEGKTIGEVLATPPNPCPGVYVIGNEQSEVIYAGETNNLAARFEATFDDRDSRKIWLAKAGSITIHFRECESVKDLRLAREALLVQWFSPDWNMVKEFIDNK